MMGPTRVFSILAWVALPTVMYGGYALLGLLQRGQLTPFQEQFFRAGHAHAGVLLLLSLLYHSFLPRTGLSAGAHWAACATLLIGVLAQSGGFFLHMALGKPGERSIGMTVTTVGALFLTAAILVLVYGLATAETKGG